MLDLCKYKDIFGKPGEGAHKYRIFNIAIVDVILTIILGIVIHRIALYFNVKICVWWFILAMFILGIISHRLFCVKTTIDKLLFNDSQ